LNEKNRIAVRANSRQWAAFGIEIGPHFVSSDEVS
jgi:hypothetical protein